MNDPPVSKLSNYRSYFDLVPGRLGIVAALFALVASGCGTTTQRMATEQLLISDAVDEAIDQIDFSALQNQTVYLDTTFLNPVKGIGFVNADYIISALRQQLTTAHCRIQEDKESADIIVEPRVGALGTDGHEVTYGIPQTSAIATATAAITSSPGLPAVPEISIGRSDAHSAVAKIIVFAFERESKRPVWQSGIAKAESNSNNTWILGAGPFQKGTIHEDVRFAGKILKKTSGETPAQLTLPKISYSFEHVFSLPDQTLVPEVRTHDAIVQEAKQPTVRQASHDE